LAAPQLLHHQEDRNPREAHTNGFQGP